MAMKVVSPSPGLLAALVLCSAALLTAQQMSPSSADDSGVIQGTVADPDGKPVADATVYAVAMKDRDRPLNGRWPENSTQSDDKGNFVLTHVTPDSNEVYAFKYSDYYEDVNNPFTFSHPPKDSEAPEVEVKPGQTVTGVIVRLPHKAGKIHLYVRDADTKELVHGIYEKLCPKGHPNNCLTGSNQSNFESLVSLWVRISIQIEADDGLHEKWAYRNPKTGSRYFKAKSGVTETVNIYLRKKK